MRQKASERVREHVEEQIASGELTPGDTIDEKSLSARFDVSRTPAREAILQLAAAGLVRLAPRHGAVVAGVSPTRVIGMLETLTALEAEAASLAARRMSTAELEQLEARHRAAEAHIRNLDSEASIEANAKFHETIYQGARNAFLAEQIDAVRKGMRHYHRSSLYQPARLVQSWREHGSVIDAMRRGAPDEAAAAMRTHIGAGGQVFADLIARMAADNPKTN